MFVVVCYDVPAERTGLFKKTLKEYLMHEQNSVFMGDISESEWIKLTSRIAQVIEPDDHILTLVCRNRHNAQVRKLTKDSAGGRMGQEDHGWHGKDWAIL